MKERIMEDMFLYAILCDEKICKEKKIQVIEEQIKVTKERLFDLNKWLAMATSQTTTKPKRKTI